MSVSANFRITSAVLNTIIQMSGGRPGSKFLQEFQIRSQIGYDPAKLKRALAALVKAGALRLDPMTRTFTLRKTGLALAKQAASRIAAADQEESQASADKGKELAKISWDKVPEEWREAILEIVLRVAQRKAEFCVDDVQDDADAAGVGDPPGIDMRGPWGNVMPGAARRGYVESTERTRTSRRTERNRSRIVIWRSKKFRNIV